MSSSAPCSRGPMVSTPLDQHIQRFVFPCQLGFLLYITARFLLQLRYGPTRIVARRTLILLTVADFCLLLTMLPQSLSTISTFYENETFR